MFDPPRRVSSQMKDRTMRTETFYAVQRKHSQELTGRLIVGDTILAIGSVTSDGSPELPAKSYQVKFGSYACSVKLTSGSAKALAVAVLTNPQSDCYGESTGAESVEPFRFDVTTRSRNTVEVVEL